MDGSEHFKSTKGGELFRGKLTRCRTAKANLTKAQTSFQKNIEDYVEAETQPIVTKRRKANAVMEGVKKMESRLENLQQNIEDFTVYVSGLGEDAFESPTTPSSVILGANKDLEDREQVMREKLTEHEEVIKRAENVLSIDPVQQVVEKPEESASFASFKQQADLKPSILEREANYAEARHFTEIFGNYLENGYGGASRVPQQMISVQLQPFVNEIWWAQMVNMNIKKKDLKGAMQVVMDVASENNPVHGRRMDLLKMRRGSMDHSTWLYKLETAMELTQWKDWTKEAMIIHLFLESADTEMSKVATAMLAKDSVNLADLRMEIRAIENSVWYKPKHQVKYAQQPNTWETDGMGGQGGLGFRMEVSDGVVTARARPTPLRPAGEHAPTAG